MGAYRNCVLKPSASYMCITVFNEVGEVAMVLYYTEQG